MSLSARHGRARRAGLTLIELLLATALSALLMGGVMSMVTSLADEASVGPALARMKRDGNIDVALRRVAWDVANGRYGVIQSSHPGGMTLVGTGRTDSWGPMAAPAVVSYAVVEAGGLSMLVRRERGAGAFDEAGGFANVVLAGVETFSVSPVRLPGAGGDGDGDGEFDEDGDEENRSDDQFLQTLVDGAQPLPRALRVRLTVAGGGVHEVVLETGGRDGQQ